jgi:predicted phosphoribosyltransferase
VRYRDRHEAGSILAAEVARSARGRCVVAAIPRGGIVVAARVAERLAAPLTMVYARKIALPTAPEFAIGALDEDGEAILEHAWPRWREVAPEDVAAARARVGAEIARQRDRYGAPALAPLARGATVVLVDDGLATGLTMRAAVAYVRRHGAARVIVAAPCASEEAAERFTREADRFVCPLVDPNFGAVGSYYRAFGSVSDEEVLATLAAARTRMTAPAGSAPPVSRWNE